MSYTFGRITDRQVEIIEDTNLLRDDSDASLSILKSIIMWLREI